MSARRTQTCRNKENIVELICKSVSTLGTEVIDSQTGLRGHRFAEAVHLCGAPCPHAQHVEAPLGAWHSLGHSHRLFSYSLSSVLLLCPENILTVTGTGPSHPNLVLRVRPILALDVKPDERRPRPYAC